MADYSVTLAVCTHRDVKIRMWSTYCMMRDCPNPKITPVIQEGDALISRSRNKIATYFLKNTQDEMLCFLDDDIEIEPLDLQRMMNEVHVNKYPILGAAYALKDPKKGGFAFMTEGKKGEIKFGLDGGIIPVKNVSTGCMIIRRDVLETFIKKGSVHLCRNSGNYGFFQHREDFSDGGWDEVSEDWWFCMEAKRLGFQVFMDTRPKLNHIGPFPYNWDFVKLNGEFKKYDNLSLSYDLK